MWVCNFVKGLGRPSRGKFGKCVSRAGKGFHVLFACIREVAHRYSYVDKDAPEVCSGTYERLTPPV